MTSGTVTITDPGHVHTVNGREALTFDGSDFLTGVLESAFIGADFTEATNSATTGISASVGTAITMTNANAGSGSAVDNMSPYLVLNYIIKT